MLTHGAIVEINERMRYASRDVNFDDVFDPGLNESHGDTAIHELLDANGDARLFSDGGEMTVDMTAGASGTIGGVNASLELSSAGNAMSALGMVVTDTKAFESGLGGSSSSFSGDSGASGALHSGDSSAGSCTKVTACLISIVPPDERSKERTRTRYIHPDLLRIPRQLEPRWRAVALMVDMAHRLEAKPRVQITRSIQPSTGIAGRSSGSHRAPNMAVPTALTASANAHG